MTAMEAGIRYELRYQRSAPPALDRVRELIAWRHLLYQTELVGREPGTYGRFGGVGYGNLSCRLPPWEGRPEGRRFLVSGTGTGCVPMLEPRHFATVLECRPDRNLVLAEGPVRPSSESLTHGTLYGLDPAIRAVVHVHSRRLWDEARALDLPITSEAATYGTPEMAEEVRRLFRDSDLPRRRIFAMGGHVTGIVSFGPTVAAAATNLLGALAMAYAREL